MQIRGIHYTICSYCRCRMSKGTSLQKHLPNGYGGYTKVCRNCYNNAGRPDELTNVVAERERKERERQRRRDRSRESTRDRRKKKQKQRQEERNHFRPQKARRIPREPGQGQQSLF